MYSDKEIENVVKTHEYLELWTTTPNSKGNWRCITCNTESLNNHTNYQILRINHGFSSSDYISSDHCKKYYNIYPPNFDEKLKAIKEFLALYPDARIYHEK